MVLGVVELMLSPPIGRENEMCSKVYERLRDHLDEDPEQVLARVENLLIPIDAKSLFPTSPSQKQVTSTSTSKYTSRQRTPAKHALVRQTSLNNHVFGLDDKRAQVHTEYKHIFSDIKNLDSSMLSVRKDIKASNHNVLSEADWALIMEAKYSDQKRREKQQQNLAQQQTMDQESSFVNDVAGGKEDNINYAPNDSKKEILIWGKPQYTNAADFKLHFADMQLLQRQKLLMDLTLRRYNRFVALSDPGVMKEKMEAIAKEVSGFNKRKWQHCQRPIDLW